MGATCEAQLERWGFYPAGGGKFAVRINPPQDGLKPLFLEERGELVQTEIFAVVSKIPREIAADEADLITRGVRFPINHSRIEEIQSGGPGNIAMLKMVFENSIAFFSGFGKIGVSRNKVAHEVSKAANGLFRYGAAMDEHLADQMLIPLALAKGGSLSTIEVTGHTETNIEIIRKFLDVSITCQKVKNFFWKLEVLGE